MKFSFLYTLLHCIRLIFNLNLISLQLVLLYFYLAIYFLWLSLYIDSCFLGPWGTHVFQKCIFLLRSDFTHPLLLWMCRIMFLSPYSADILIGPKLFSHFDWNKAGNIYALSLSRTGCVEFPWPYSVSAWVLVKSPCQVSRLEATLRWTASRQPPSVRQVFVSCILAVLRRELPLLPLLGCLTFWTDAIHEKL